MTLKWQYQKDRQKYVKHDWDVGNRAYLREYRQQYRRQHPESTREQWKRDTRRYRMRHDPAALRERQRIYDARYQAKLKAIKQALKEKGDSDYAGSSEEGNC